MLSPQSAGDEPVLLAQRLPGVPVVVGRDRRVSGKMACETFAPDVLVCDDALQFWQLFRDLNIVLLDARRPWDNGYVLPRGLLREPPRHLARAGIIVLTRADRASGQSLRETKAQITKYAPHTDVFCATHAPQSWVRVGEGNALNAPLPLGHLSGETAFVFSGIADHAAFVQTVRAQNVPVVGERVFPDHYAYSQSDVSDILARAHELSASVLVTTEKDGVKIGPLWTGKANPPIYALRVAMQIENEAAFFARINAALLSVS